MAGCIPCLSEGIKKYLKQAVDQELHQMIDEMPTCGTGVVMVLCPLPVSTRTRKSSGEKRPRSAYNSFISGCMKSKPIKGKPFGAASGYMKECAAQWQTQKSKS